MIDSLKKMKSLISMVYSNINSNLVFYFNKKPLVLCHDFLIRFAWNQLKYYFHVRNKLFNTGNIISKIKAKFRLRYRNFKTKRTKSQLIFNLFMHNIVKWWNILQTYFPNQDFYGMLGHFATLCMKGLRWHIAFARGNRDVGVRRHYWFDI